MLPRIDYDYIAAAISFYEKEGYSYIELPWLASKESMNVTSPINRKLFETFSGCLLASGEQAFIEGRNYLPKGKFMCATPCFRDEPLLDKYHHPSFFKVELIETHSNLADDMEDMIVDALCFFSKYIGKSDKLEVIGTEEGKDISLNGVELGSYGLRTYNGFDWVYGTGLAEPRFSQILRNSY